jgi:hypothetical protein
MWDVTQDTWEKASYVSDFEEWYSIEVWWNSLFIPCIGDVSIPSVSSGDTGSI